MATPSSNNLMVVPVYGNYAISDMGGPIDDEEANCLIEERMLDIARILGASLDGRIGEFQYSIWEMLE